MAADQRRRLKEAAIALVAEGGYSSVTVRALAREAEVSTRAFYRQFSNIADCVRFASETTMLDALARMREGALAEPGDGSSIPAAVSSLMRFFASSPAATAVALIEAYDAGPSVLARLRFVTTTFELSFAELLDVSTDSVTGEGKRVSGIVAGVLRVARATSMAGRTSELPELAAVLSDWVTAVASPSGARLGPTIRRPAASSPHRDEVRIDGVGWRSDDTTLTKGDERGRIVRAAVRLSAEDGPAALTITQIRRAAGVSRRSFDRYFATAPECVLASVEWLVLRAAARARLWANKDPDPVARTRRIALFLCSQVADNKALAPLIFEGLLEMGRDGMLCRERILATGAEQMREGANTTGSADTVAADASAAAAWRIAEMEVVGGRTGSLPRLAPLLDSILMVPVERQSIRGPARSNSAPASTGDAR